MKYAICNETFAGWDHAHICEQIANLGYSGLEIAPFTLAPRITDVSPDQRRELRRVAESHGIMIIGLHWLLAKTEGFQLTSADAQIRLHTGMYLAELAKAARDLGGHILVLGSPVQRNIPAGYTLEQATDFALDTLSHALSSLEREQVFLCLEPLTPKETNFMNTASDAVAMIQRLGHPNVKLHLDVKAMSAEAKPTPEVIREFAPYTEHFHANDVNLRGPGFGDVDFVPIFQALADSQYQGWVSVEVFNYDPDPITIARESIRYMKECSEQVMKQ